ncbi:hypothetical protein J2W42_006554 [Rhizobium tibeticum]|uniref:hypothetical protein n=1 Tax=Rhizobium tibeticum TaxID=501024 RepID=UPI00277EFA3D|nr:hypothetical protein [Rhizobium tibeticum]MDP9813679.1 hypothetical protein [Rhizobium tibeticum]
MTRYTLLASGLPAVGILNVNIFAEAEDDARQQALATGMRLHLAGYNNFDLFDDGEGPAATLYLSFRTATAEPTVEIIAGG